MSTPIQIRDGTGRASKACVTPIGQLVTAPYAYDEVTALTLDVVNTSYNFYPPKANEQFVITGILLTADSNVTGSTLIDVYEAEDSTDTAITKTILRVEVLKNGYRDITGLNILVPEGLFVNAKCDDDDVFCTVMGYYIPAVNGD